MLAVVGLEKVACRTASVALKANTGLTRAQFVPQAAHLMIVASEPIKQRRLTNARSQISRPRT